MRELRHRHAPYLMRWSRSQVRTSRTWRRSRPLKLRTRHPSVHGEGSQHKGVFGIGSRWTIVRGLLQGQVRYREYQNKSEIRSQRSGERRKAGMCVREGGREEGGGRDDGKVRELRHRHALYLMRWSRSQVRTSRTWRRSRPLASRTSIRSDRAENSEMADVRDTGRGMCAAEQYGEKGAEDVC